MNLNVKATAVNGSNYQSLVQSDISITASQLLEGPELEAIVQYQANEKLREENDQLRAESLLKDEKLQDQRKWLEFFVDNISTQLNSAQSLKAGDALYDIVDISRSIKENLSTIDYLRQENFSLKREMALEKKKYNDLKLAFLELRHQQLKAQKDVYQERPDIMTLLCERDNLQTTLKCLTEEVELLSRKN